MNIPTIFPFLGEIQSVNLPFWMTNLPFGSLSLDVTDIAMDNRHRLFFFQEVNYGIAKVLLLDCCYAQLSHFDFLSTFNLG